MQWERQGGGSELIFFYLYERWGREKKMETRKNELKGLPMSKNGCFIFPDKTERYARKNEKYDGNKSYMEIMEYPENNGIKFILTGRNFSQIVEATRMLQDETVMNFTPEGLSIKASDTAHVAMEVIFMPKEEFVEYNLGHRYFKYGISIKKLRDLRITGRTGNISISIEPQQVKSTVSSQKIYINGMGWLHYRSIQYYSDIITIECINGVNKLPTIMYDTLVEINVPEITADTNIVVPLNELRDFTNASLKIGDLIKFTISEFGFEMECHGDENNEKRVLIRRKDIKGLMEYQKVSSYYSTECLAKICTAIRNVELGKISFKDDYPLTMIFYFDNNSMSIRYLLAPQWNANSIG